jgi:hypothetical protein
MRSTGNCPNAFTGQQIPPAQALQVDITGNCEADFVMQVFRTPGSPANAQRPISFDIGVRVYAVIRDVDSVPWQNLNTDPAPLRMTSGEGKQNTSPLAAIYSNVSWGDTRDSLRCYHNDC